MGKSVNKVILLGHVGKDPEIRTTNGGALVANLSIATTDRYKDSRGEWQDRTEWHNLAACARGAEILRDYVKKGSKLYVEGKLQTSTWEDRQNGGKKYRTEIVARDIVLLGSQDNGQEGGGETSGEQSNRQPVPAVAGDDTPF